MEKPRHEQVAEFADSKLPKTEDLTLLILKGHLLIERVIEEFIAEHIADREAFREARLSSFQKIQLAIAIDGRLPPEEDDGFWDAVKQMNKLRNALAHKLTVPDVEDQVRIMLYGPSKRSEFEDQRPLHAILREYIGGLCVYLDAALEVHEEEKWSNKVLEPTPGTVTPPTEPEVSPVPPVAHL